MEPVFPFDIVLPAPGPGTLVHALHQQLRAAILDARLAPGAPLPATRQVAAALGVARNTVIAAYDLLIAEGYASARSGAKARVADIGARRGAKPPRPAPQRDDPAFNPVWRSPSWPAAHRGTLPAHSFRMGVPEHRHFPHAIWRRLSAQSLRAWSRAEFGYAPSEGIPALREAIAQHVAFARAVACTRDDVIVTSGAQQAFDLIARLLVTPGRTVVAVEEPGYPPLRAAFAAAGARLVGIAVDDEGLCVEDLPRDVRVINITPSHQSPTGVVLSSRRRQALLAFAHAHGAVIVEDDYDGEFRFGGRPLDALQTLDRDARVLYVGTFSKSLFPALRKGFVIAPHWAREPLIAVKRCADSHCDTMTQALLAAFIRDGHLARHVRRMQTLYAARRGVLLEVLNRELGAWLEPIPGEAGLHLAARIRTREHTASILAKARRYAPGVQSTDDYAMTPLARPALTFGYGTINASDIPAALSPLCRALQASGTD